MPDDQQKKTEQVRVGPTSPQSAPSRLASVRLTSGPSLQGAEYVHKPSRSDGHINWEFTEEPLKTPINLGFHVASPPRTELPVSSLPAAHGNAGGDPLATPSKHTLSWEAKPGSPKSPGQSFHRSTSLESLVSGTTPSSRDYTSASDASRAASYGGGTPSSVNTETFISRIQRAWNDSLDTGGAREDENDKVAGIPVKVIQTFYQVWLAPVLAPIPALFNKWWDSMSGSGGRARQASARTSPTLVENLTPAEMFSGRIAAVVALTVLVGLLLYSWLERHRRETKVEFVGSGSGPASGRAIAYVPYKMHALGEVNNTKALPDQANRSSASPRVGEGLVLADEQHRGSPGNSAAHEYEYPPRYSGN